MKTKELTLTSVLLALTFVITRFIQIPIPLGYFNIGNSVILTGCVFLPQPFGIIAGSLGSALADLTSYPMYTIPTLIIKALMPWTFYAFQKLSIKNNYLKDVLACAVATLIPLFGYTITGGILYGSIYTGLAQFPGLFLEYVANLVLFSVVLGALKQVNIQKITA